MRIEIPTEGIEQLIDSLGFDYAKNVLTGRAVSLVMDSIETEMQRYAERREARQKNRIMGSPASANNLQQPAPPQPPDLPDLNYFAPKKNLQVMLCEDWFDKVCADKKMYTSSWREKFVADLMASEYRDELARTWENRSLRLQLKGHVIGALITAGVIKKKALAVARTYYNTNENTAEVKTLAKYMGDSRKEYYTDWIVDYVKSQQPIEK